MTTSRLRTVRAALATAAVVGTLAACGSSGDSPAPASSPAAAGRTTGEAAEQPTSDPVTSTDGVDPAAESAATSGGLVEGNGPAQEQTQEQTRQEGSVYRDGTYTAEGSYVSPNGWESVGVELTITDDVVTGVTVTPHPSNPNTAQYQGMFAQGIADVVVGRPLDELHVDRVSGSSLTSGGFNEAVELIKSEARG